MNINLVADRSRRSAYVKAQTNAAQTEKKADAPVPASSQDEVVISSRAREILAKQGADYVNGHLADVNTHQEMDDETLSEVMRQAGPISARYSGTYDPHKEPMNGQMLSLNPNSPLNTPENKDRISAAIRVSAPELIAEFRARKREMGFAIDQNRGLIINKDREIDPDNSIALKTYLQAYA